MLSVVVLAGVVIVTGCAVAFALYGPGRLSLPSRLALVVAFGYLVPAAVAFCLTVLDILNPPTMLIGLLVAIGLGCFVASRRFGLRRQVLTMVADARRSKLIAFGLLVVLSFALYRAAFPPELNFLQSTGFRYWADGAEIADAGSIPEQVLHWGKFYTPTVSKVLLNSFTAGLVFIAPDDPLQGLGALLWVSSVGLGVALWALGHELGLRRTAPFLPLLVLVDPGVFNREMTSDLFTYKTETVGRLVAVVALSVAVRALRPEGRRVDAIVAGVLVAGTAATHVTPLLVVLVALFWYALAEGILTRQLKRVSLTVGTMLLVAVPTAVLVPVLSGGDLGFEGVQGTGAYESFDGEEDPTAFFADPRAHLEGESSPRTTIPSVGDIAERYVSTSLGGHVSGWATVVAALIFAGLVVFVVLRLDEPLRRIAFLAGGVAISLLALCVLITQRYDTYIPAATGLRRLFDYNSIPVILALAAVVEGGLVVMDRLRLRVAIAALTAVAVGLSVGALNAALPSARARNRTKASSAPFEWLRRNTDCGSRILASSRSEGVFQAMSGRVGVLEGMSPYLRPIMLRDVLGLLTRADDFFRAPRDEAEFLEEEAVDFVYLDGEVPMGGSRIAPKELEELNGIPFLRNVYATKAAKIYAVEGAYDQPDSGGVPRASVGYCLGTD